MLRITQQTNISSEERVSLLTRDALQNNTRKLSDLNENSCLSSIRESDIEIIHQMQSGLNKNIDIRRSTGIFINKHDIEMYEAAPTKNTIPEDGNEEEKAFILKDDSNDRILDGDSDTGLRKEQSQTDHDNSFEKDLAKYNKNKQTKSLPKRHRLHEIKVATSQCCNTICIQNIQKSSRTTKEDMKELCVVAVNLCRINR